MQNRTLPRSTDSELFIKANERLSVREASFTPLIFYLESINACQTPLIAVSKVVTSGADFTSNTWCPAALDADRFLLLSLTNLTYIARFNAQTTAPNVHYHLQYTRDDLLDADTTWHAYRLLSNTDESIQLNPPIIAKHVRLQIKHATTDLCVQVEFFGCPFTDGVVSYNMLQGANQLEDDTYDGQYNEQNRHLYGRELLPLRRVVFTLLVFLLQVVSDSYPMVRPDRTTTRIFSACNG